MQIFSLSKINDKEKKRLTKNHLNLILHKSFLSFIRFSSNADSLRNERKYSQMQNFMRERRAASIGIDNMVTSTQSEG